MNLFDLSMDVSLIRGDLLFRLQRRIGLIPKDGLGLVRRALFFASFTWLPLAIWAISHDKAFPSPNGESFFSQFGIHARFLAAIPLLIFNEGLLHGLCYKYIPYFASSGLIRENQQNGFREAIHKTLMLRDSTIPWVVILTFVCTLIFLQPPTPEMHELRWTYVGEGGEDQLGFAGWWLIYAGRPVFLALVCIALWRLVLLFVLFKRIAALDLELVPTHPDSAGGLGFLEKMPKAFSLVVFSLSFAMASRLAHDVIYHNLQVNDLNLLAGMFVVIITLLFLSPLLVFAPKMLAAKYKAILDYGTLIGNHGRFVHRRWILREPVTDDSLLQAPEIGPVADAISLYEAVSRMRIVPIGKRAVLNIALPAAMPLAGLYAIQFPIKDVLLKILTSFI